MASRRRSNPKGRGGSSGGANPRNDGRITEQQHEDAMRVLRAEYYQGVRSVAQDIGDRVKDKEITSQDDFERAIHEAVDGSYWVIYTHANMQVLMCSDNSDAYFDEGIGSGEELCSRGGIDWMVLAFYAMERDVRQQIDAEGIEPDWSSMEEAPRRARERQLHPRVRESARGPRGLRRR